MNLSQKCQYALRSLFELARRQGEGPVSVAEIAKAQAIPPRFLELILGELRHAGYVESRRGVQGGYMLAVSARQVSVGDVIRFVDGPLAPVKCLGEQGDKTCLLLGRCAFMGLWERAMQAASEVYDLTSLQDLVDQQHSPQTANYCI